MKYDVCLALLGATTFGAGCVTAPGWKSAEALKADMVEVQIDSAGRPLEVEYHVSPELVPANVHAAMDALHPGGRAIAAEKEYVGTALFWELTKEIDGLEVEALFHPDGRLESEEIEVAASSVPDAVKKAVRARIGGEFTKFEEIRDGNRMLVQYHVKTTAKGMNYKVMVGVGGTVLGVVREVPAEIEVPVE